MRETAVVLTGGRYRTVYAKTAHGLVRGPSRFRVLAIVDSSCPGEDAGTLLDGTRRGIPIVASVAEALALGERPDHAVIGVATKGGMLPETLRDELIVAARAGLHLINGLHQFLADDPELVALADAHDARIVDFRRPRPSTELRFWTGEVLDLAVPLVAVLGTDCALGKRTTAGLLQAALAHRGVRAEMVYTGQTGWLQGYRYGFIFDATPNDFVCGELEAAVLDCARETEPDVILVEGQSALRNPSGPCGAELLVSLGTRDVILAHSPGRKYFKDLDELGCVIPPLAGEIALIRAYGAEVRALAVHEEGLDAVAAEAARADLETTLGIPAVLPLRGGVDRLGDVLIEHLGLDAGATGNES